jgi:membrane fusion protein (multidrug efflux system)
MAIPGSVSKSRWIAAAAVAVVVILAGAGWLFFGHAAKSPQAAAAPPPAPAVGVRVATMKGVSQSFEFVGRIKATDKVEIRARVEGFLQKVLFKEGQDVKTGDLLYQIEKVQFQAAVDQARANIVVAETS